MPPQPLSSFRKRKAKLSYDLTPNRIEDRPELAILVAKAIAIAANIEMQWGRLLAGTLGPTAAPTVAAYLALSGGNAQRAALEAALGKMLSAPQKEMFDALAIIARPLAQMRNRLVHGGWGICHELPDALILQEPESVIEAHSAIDDYVRRKVSGEAPLLEPQDDLTKILVFRKKDLVEFNEALGRMRRYLVMFTLERSRENIHGKSATDPLSARLRVEPEILEALARLQTRTGRKQSRQRGHPLKS